ncbi:MAG: InlB B-repeat-containing protein [Clostridiales bacterium]|nr:InlB B-repeat-containing protein [Clostridiales bacterium]
MTLYAKWIEDSETHDNVTVRYFYNIGDGDVLYATVSVEFNGTVGSNAPADPEVNDYYFAGWFRDKAFTIKFSNNMNLTEDIDVYGNMLKKYTFEAEAVDFTGKTGQGTSTNSFEEQMIMDHTFVSGGDVSNGYFVRELYYNGAFLDFEIYAEDAISDAVLYLRVSSESYEFFTTKVVNGVVYNYLSDEEFKIVVNGEWDGDIPLTWIEYDGLYMPMANLVDSADLSQNKTPFENCFITDKLSLNQGRNVISLYVGNNNNHGGTFHAEAPIIDCIYIYSSTELTMTDYKFYERPNVIRG